MSIDNESNPPEQNKLLSINDVIRTYKAAHPFRYKWLTYIHLTGIISWLVLRYAVVRPVLIYCKELYEQKQNLSYKSTRHTNL